MSASTRSQRSFNCREFRVERPSDFVMFSEVWFAGLPAQVVCSSEETVTCQFSEFHDLVIPYRSGSVVSVGFGLLPEGYRRSASHWYPVWNRDSPGEEQDIESWGGYLALLEHCHLPEVSVSVKRGTPRFG